MLRFCVGAWSRSEAGIDITVFVFIFFIRICTARIVILLFVFDKIEYECGYDLTVEYIL